MATTKATSCQNTATVCRSDEEHFHPFSPVLPISLIDLHFNVPNVHDAGREYTSKRYHVARKTG